MKYSISFSSLRCTQNLPTMRRTGGANATLSYDVLDHLVQWNAGCTNQEWSAYDASGNCMLLRSTSGTGTTITTYPFGLEEHLYGATGSNQGNTYYYTLAGRLVGLASGTSTLSTQDLLTDALGSVLATFSATPGSAVVVGNQAYGPYGNALYAQGVMGTAKGYTGQYGDSIGLDYYNARYYDPVVGLFISADTVQGNVQGVDPYASAVGNPETMTDPTGLFSGLVAGGFGLLAAAAIAVAVGIAFAPVVAGVAGAVLTGALIGAAVQYQNDRSDPTLSEGQKEDRMGAAMIWGGIIGGAVALAAAATTIGLSVGLGFGWAEGIEAAAAPPLGIIGGIAGNAAAGLATANLSNPFMPSNNPCGQQFNCSPKPAGCPQNPGQNCTPKTPIPTNTSRKSSVSQQQSQSSQFQRPTQGSGGGSWYTVTSGDTLWGIASRFYGSGLQWQSLYQRNRGVIGGNPNLIYPGERLAL